MKLEHSDGIDLLYGRKGPTRKQELFRDNPARYRLYGGAVGGGKTWALGAEGIRLSLAYPGNRGFMFRHESTAFRRTTLVTLFKIIDEVQNETRSKILETHRKTDKEVWFVNGSHIIYGGLGDTSDVERIKSLEGGWFGIDEASECEEENYRMLKSRLRWRLKDGTYPPFFGLLASNPEPGWVKNTFVTPQKMGQPLPDHAFIQALPSDNPYLPPTYLDDLRATNPEHWVRKYIEGSWDALEGQIFSEFDHSTHVIKPFPISDSWMRFRTLDHGQSNPTACYWIAVDPDGNLFVYREYYSPGIVSQHCQAINDLTVESDIEYTVLPPDCWGKNREKYGRLWSVYDEYCENGIYPIRANNEVNAGLNRVNEYLKVDPERVHPLTGKKGSPRLFIFDNCHNLILEIPDYIWDKDKEKPVKKNDHGCDALRYGVMTRPHPHQQKDIIPFNSFLATRKRMIEAQKWAERRGTTITEEWNRRLH